MTESSFLRRLEVNTENVKNGEASRRCRPKSSGRSPARAAGRRTKRERRTNGRPTKRVGRPQGRAGEPRRPWPARRPAERRHRRSGHDVDERRLVNGTVARSSRVATHRRFGGDDNVKTRSRGLGHGSTAPCRSERERSDRFFRDIHGTEFSRPPRHRPRRLRRRRKRDRRRRRSSATLDCGLCRPARCSRTVSGRSAAIVAAPTTSRATPTSATSPARSPSASGIARRSSARSCSTRASIATCGRSSSTIRNSAASSIAIRA